MPVFDPKLTRLFKNGRVVDGFRVAGRVAELALKETLRTGVSGLAVGDLPSSIPLKLDDVGDALVRVTLADATAAVGVAQHVRCKLHGAGWAVVGAVVAENSDKGAFLGEHDLIVDEVKTHDGRGLVSCEVKCRRLYSEAGREKVRLALRREQVDDCPWWQAALAKPCALWRGRMVILVVCDRAGSLVGSCAEWRPLGAEWRSLWGFGAVLPSPAAALPRQAAARTLPSVRARFPKLTYRRVQGQLVAPVAGVLGALKRGLSNVGRDVAAFKRKNRDVSEADLYKAPRKVGRKGGSPEWVATEAVLKRLHASL